MKKFLADLHTHTKYSHDSLSEPKDLLEAAVRKGLSAVAITDHNEINGALEAKKIAAEMKLPIQVIVGEEVYTDKGDLLVYFLKEKIAPGSLASALSEAKRQNAVCSMAHPFDFARKGMMTQKPSEGLVDKIAAVEVLNARVFLESENRSALDFATLRRKVFLAGSDSHHPSEVGAAYVEYEGVRALDARTLLFAKHAICGKRSSPLVRFHSRYAKLRKKLFWRSHD
jgi:predicted metal-dependent phosphoesterase TrpH